MLSVFLDRETYLHWLGELADVWSIGAGLAAARPHAHPAGLSGWLGLRGPRAGTWGPLSRGRSSAATIDEDAPAPAPSATDRSWARLRTDTNCRLRRGAWYPVAELGLLEVVVEVCGSPRPVSRHLLEISPYPPTMWTVVPRPRAAAPLPASWGARYAVCPKCQDRAPIGGGRPPRLRCWRCHGDFHVNWNEAYLSAS